MFISWVKPLTEHHKKGSPLDVVNVVAGLRELADYLEANHTTLPGIEYGYPPNVSVWASKEELAEAVQSPGTWEKNFDDATAYFIRRFSGDVLIKFFTGRDNICVKKQTGVKVVKKLRELSEEDYIEVTEPVYEWECKPLLGNEEDSAEAIEA
jgi:hypothetical protein